MEQNILNALQNLEGEVKATNLTSGLSFEFGGEVKIERGAFSMEINFYAKLYETKHKGIISLDDWDVNDTYCHNLNGLPIDNISAFKQKLNEWGLGSVSNKLDFSTQEQRQAICMAIQQSDDVKRVFGKKVKVWDLLSVDEQKLLELQYIVENFKSCGDHLKKEVAKHYKIGEQPQENPTLDQFQEKLAELSK